MRSDECVDQPASGCGALRLAQALARTRGARGLDERGRVRRDGCIRHQTAAIVRGATTPGSRSASIVSARRSSAASARHHRRAESRGDESLHGRRGLRLEHEARLDAVRPQLLLDVLARRRVRDQRQPRELLAVDETPARRRAARPPAAGRRTDPRRAAQRRAGPSAAASRRARCRARRARARRAARACRRRLVQRDRRAVDAQERRNEAREHVGRRADAQRCGALPSSAARSACAARTRAISASVWRAGSRRPA